jgi:hypothetical protein
MVAQSQASIVTPGVHDVGAGGGDPRERVLEVHGCLVIGGPDLERRTYPGGPTLVRGLHALVDDDDVVEVTRRVVAICRCGKSQLRPFCDGTHRFVPGFDGRPG